MPLSIFHWNIVSSGLILKKYKLWFWKKITPYRYINVYKLYHVLFLQCVGKNKLISISNVLNNNLWITNDKTMTRCHSLSNFTTKLTSNSIPISMHCTGVDVKLVIIRRSDRSNLDFNIPVFRSTIYIHL